MALADSKKSVYISPQPYFFYQYFMFLVFKKKIYILQRERGNQLFGGNQKIVEGNKIVLEGNEKRERL
jgi:hypothetical protein